MGFKYNSKISVSPYNVAKPQPLDIRTVVESVDDLKSAEFIDSRAYNGMVVFVDDSETNNRSLYVCFNKPEEIDEDLTNVEDVWRKLDTDYSIRIVESEDDLLDENIIMFPYQGMMAYVTSESSLYILMSKGIKKAREIGNWRKISASSSTLKDKVGINVKPEGGSGFMIAENKSVYIDDYVNVENYIKKDYYYTSKGINSFDPNPDFSKYEFVKLSQKGVDAYIKLFAAGNENWIEIHNPAGLGLNINIKDKGYVSDEPIVIAKETPICFGSDIKFHEGWFISYGDDDVAEEFKFTSDHYELIDIYRSEWSPEVYAYLNDIDVRILTEDDLVTIDDKIDNMANSIMIDLDEDSDGSSDSDDEEPRPLQEVIVQMNNQISKLEQIKVEPETIEDNEIVSLFQ